MYAKIFAQIFDSSLADDYETRHVFIDLLILADADGVVDMTREAIARRTNAPLDLVSRCIDKLMQPDPQSRTPDDAGKRLVLLDDHRDWGWQIANYGKFKSIQDRDMQRAYNTAYQRRRRARLAKVAVVNNVKDGQGQSSLISASAYDSIKDVKDVNAAKPISSSEQMTLTNLVKQFVKQCQWTGDPRKIYQHFRDAMKFCDEGKLSAEIAQATPGDAPWEIIKRIQRREHPRKSDKERELEADLDAVFRKEKK